MSDLGLTPADADPQETREWLDALEAVIEQEGPERAHYLIENLATRKPASVKLCSLLHKPDRTVRPVTIDYLGFTIPNKFVVGYGLDFQERFRGVPEVGILKPEEIEGLPDRGGEPTLPGAPDQHVMFPWRWELERDGGDVYLLSSPDGAVPNPGAAKIRSKTRNSPARMRG